MKIKIKRILTILMAVMAIFAFSAVPAFADDTTTEGTGDVTATVPVEGSISAITISVTHPATVAYTIDPNSGLTNDIVAPDISLVNNTPGAGQCNRAVVCVVSRRNTSAYRCWSS